MRPSLLIATIVVWLTLVPAPLYAQQPDLLAEWLGRVNQLRLDENLAPYSTFTLLNDAAQRHAEDLAANGLSSTTGSNGSTPGHRAAAAGYTAWTNDDGAPVVGENVWVGVGTIDDALAYFLGDPASRGNLLSPAFREIGIGIAAGADGRDYYVLDFGARPNVLPIAINYGEISSESTQVAIRLTNEEVRPGGEGAVFMGRAIEIRISDEPNWDEVEWQPWEELVPWTLPDSLGEHPVYVQYRDAAGRMAASGDSIYLGDVPPTTAPPSPPPETADTPAAPEDGAGEPPATAGPSATQPPSQSPSPAETPIPVGVTPFPTWTPLPTEGLPAEEPASSGETEYPFGLLLGLQGVALILGIYLVLHRGRRPRDSGGRDSG